MTESFTKIKDIRDKIFPARYGVRYQGEVAEESKKFTRRGAIKAKQAEYNRLKAISIGEYARDSEQKKVGLYLHSATIVRLMASAKE